MREKLSQHPSQSKQIFLVLGYSTELTPAIECYLDEVAMSAKQLPSPECIILCGGVTTPLTNPGLSEAEVMETYLHTLLPDMKFVREDCSLTTQENISYAAEIVRRDMLCAGNDHNARSYHLTVFCNAAHGIKVALAMQKYLGHICTFEVAGHLIDPSFSRTLIQLFVASPIDWLCLKSPLLTELKHMFKSAMIANR